VDIIESPQREHHPSSAPRVAVPNSIHTNDTKFSSQITNHSTQVCHSNHTTSHEKEECRSTQLVIGHAGGDCTTRKSCFYLPLGPPNTPVILQPTKSEQIFMPEMVNAVICPDTGKWLKHSDLVILLRYKMRWMR
jgi:hypothetical protein